MIGTLLGGLKAARAMREYTATIDADERHARQRRDRLLNEDPTRRADARYLLERLDRRLKERTRRIDSVAALTGGSPYASAVDRQAAADAMASATGQVASAARARADSADRDYEAARTRLREQRRQLLGQQARESVKSGAQLDTALLAGLIF